MGWRGGPRYARRSETRRIKAEAWAKSTGVPIIHSKAGERNEDLAERFRPAEPDFEGVFLIIVKRAPGSVWDVE